MFWAVISCFLGVIWKVYEKKTLNISTLPKIPFQFTWEIIWLLIVFWLILFVKFNFINFLNYKYVILFVFISIFYLWHMYLELKLYKTEKFSDLVPYENLSKIFVVMSWYLVLNDSSLISFLIWLIIIVVVILFSLDFKNLKFPNNLKTIILREFLVFGEIFTSWYLLISLTEVEYAIMYQFILITILLCILLYHGWLKYFSKLKVDFFKFRVLWYTAFFLSYMIDIFLIRELWLVYSILLSFLGQWILIAFWYVFLKERPEIKDIISALIVAALVWLAFYFR